MAATTGSAALGESIPAMFRTLSKEALAQLQAAMTRQPFTAGNVIISQGSAVDHLYVVDRGMLRAEVPDRHGLPFEVARFGPGDSFGEMSFLRGDRASATVRALGEGSLWLVPHGLLSELAADNSAFIRDIAVMVAGRLDEANLRLRQLRPGRTLGCADSGSPWGRALLEAVLVSASRHLARPVLVIELAAGQLALRTGEVIASLEPEDAPASVLTACERFSIRDEPITGSVRVAPGCDGEVLRQVLSQLRRQMPLVSVHLPPDGARDEGLEHELEGFLDVVEETAKAASPSARKGGAHDIALLRRADAAVTNGVLARARHDHGENVVRVVPGGPEPLLRLPLANRELEPQSSIDWLARHVLRQKVGIALGAGGSKGYAHLGVVSHLHAMGVPIDFVAGTSIGAPVAVGVANGMPVNELKRSLDETFIRALRPTLPLHSFLSSRTLGQDLGRLTHGRAFADLLKPLAIVAVDLAERSEVVLREGSLADAMMASLAIPGIFPPVRLNGRLLVDGGLLNPVPIRTVAEMGADIVIGVRLSNAASDDTVSTRRRIALRAPPIVDTILAAFEVMQEKISVEGAARADVTIEPVFHGPTGLRDFKRGREFMAIGREAAEAVRPRLRELLPWVR